MKGITIAGLVAALGVMQGCAGMGEGRTISVTSQPQGAAVHADGRPIGATPLQLSQEQVFPPRWYGTSYMVKGELEFRKPGCETYRMKVDDRILLNDIHARLNCESGSASVAEPARPASAAPASAMPQDIEARLGTLQRLLDKGIISRDEYRQQRQRILDSL